MAHQPGPVLAAAAPRWHLLHSRHPQQQALVEHIRANPQKPLHQPVLPVGQPQKQQAGIVAVATYRLAWCGLQPELALHQLAAAAYRALVHGEHPRRPVLGARQLEVVKDVQILQRRGWGVAVRGTGSGHVGLGVASGSLCAAGPWRHSSHAKNWRALPLARAMGDQAEVGSIGRVPDRSQWGPVERPACLPACLLLLGAALLAEHRPEGHLGRCSRQRFPRPWQHA